MKMIKLDIIKRTFRKLNLSGASSDPSIPQYDDALIDLEYMMSEWNQMPSVNTGYNSTGENAELDEESGLTLGDIEAVSNNLALRIGADYRIEIPADVRMAAKAGLSSLMKRGATIPCPSYTSRTPRGLGNINRGQYLYFNSFYNDQRSSSDAEQVKVNDIGNYTAEFRGWLTGNTLVSAEWTQRSNKIGISNVATGTTATSATLTFSNQGVYDIDVKVTDSQGQVTTQTIEFAVNAV